MQKYSLGLLELKNKKLQLVLLYRSHFLQTKTETLTDSLHKYSIYLLVDEDDEDWFIVSVQKEKEMTQLVGSEDINSFRQIDPFGVQLGLRKLSGVDRNCKGLNRKSHFIKQWCYRAV